MAVTNSADRALATGAHARAGSGDLRARAVEFTPTKLVVTLADSRRIATPLAWYPRLQRATASERAFFEIMPMGIHWPGIDEDLSIAGMLKGRSGR